MRWMMFAGVFVLGLACSHRQPKPVATPAWTAESPVEEMQDAPDATPQPEPSSGLVTAGNTELCPVVTAVFASLPSMMALRVGPPHTDEDGGTFWNASQGGPNDYSSRVYQESGGEPMFEMQFAEDLASGRPQLGACSALAGATFVRKSGDGDAIFDSVTFSVPRSQVVVMFDDHGILTIR